MKKDIAVIVRGCATSTYTRNVHSQKTWQFLRKSYLKSQHESVTPEIRKTGMMVPYEVRKDPKRGRGVYVTEDVPKGSQMWNDLQSAEFDSSRQLIQFLKRLPYGLQCDVLLWAYPESGVANVALDEGSFVNHAENKEEITMNDWGIAPRNIKAGEPILMNYTSFITYKKVKWFDEIRSAAWDSGGNSSVYASTEDYTRLGSPPVESRDGDKAHHHRHSKKDHHHHDHKSHHNSHVDETSLEEVMRNSQQYNMLVIVVLSFTMMVLSKYRRLFRVAKLDKL